MRHGRKSKSKRFNGYKRHIAPDIDTRLILACAVTPANRPEEEAAPELQSDIEHQNLKIAELHIHHGYVAAATVPRVLDTGAVLCKPWVARNSAAIFTKKDFYVDMRRLTITCPAGETESFTRVRESSLNWKRAGDVACGANARWQPSAAEPCQLPRTSASSIVYES
jgi:hypothetical protein